MNDGTIDYTPKHKVEPTDLPLRCQRCQGNNAHWVVDGTHMCHLCLLDLSGLDVDYERDLFDARSCPELVAVLMNDVHIRAFGSTAVAPLCKLLNTLPKSVGPDTEIHIEFWQARGIGCTARLMLEGEGWYTIESRTERCHAPLIRLARAPRGKMSGFMKMLNDHSLIIRRRMIREHTGEAPHA